MKFIGDAGLAVFPPESGEAVVFALCDLARATRECAQGFGLDTSLSVNIHVGQVVAGEFGPPGATRFDVLGKAVNVAARLGRCGVTLSPQALHLLPPASQQRFEEIAPPLTYRLRETNT